MKATTIPESGLAGVDVGPGPMTVLALSGLVPAALPEASLVEVVGLLDEQVAWLHSLRARHLAELAARHADDVVDLPPAAAGEWRDGRTEADTPQWERETIGLRCQLSTYEARARLETAVALAERLPATSRLLALGGLSWSHAVALTQETAGLDVVESGRVERRLHADGRAVTAGQYRRRARRLAAALRPHPDPEADEVPERSLEAWGDRTGVELRVRLTAEGGATVATALDALATRTGPGDDRPVGVRRADALVEICRLRLDAGGLPLTTAAVRPHLTVTVPLSTLAGDDDMPASVGTLDIPATAARRLACDAGIAPLLHTATVVELGREARLPTAGLRRRLEARDGGCRFPTCTRPAGRCHAHHVTHWAAGGATDESNLLLVCSRHHHLLHEGGWGLTLDGSAATWTTPDGVRYDGPPPLARPPEPDPDFYAWLPDPPTWAAPATLAATWAAPPTPVPPPPAAAIDACCDDQPPF